MNIADSKKRRRFKNSIIMKKILSTEIEQGLCTLYIAEAYVHA